MQILKKFITFGIPIIIGLSFLSTDTFSLFTSTKTNTGNTFSAGSVNIVDGNKNDSDLKLKNVDINNNGKRTFLETYTVKNTGTLDAYYHIILEDFKIINENKITYKLTNTDGSAYNQGEEPSYWDLKDKLPFTIKSGTTTLFDINGINGKEGLITLGRWKELLANSGSSESIAVSITAPNKWSVTGNIRFEPIIKRNNSSIYNGNTR